MKKNLLSFGIKNLKFEIADKPNWMAFTGTCAFIDTPSDGIPSGGADKPVSFPMEEVIKGLPTITDMGINCFWPDGWGGSPDEIFQGHDSRFKIGVIKTGEIQGNEIVISGGLWALDFADVCDMVKVAKESLGWSVEILHFLRDAGDHYEAFDIDFIGCALMWADRAAFKKTRLAAQQAKNKLNGGDKKMELTKEDLNTMLEVLYGKFEKKVDEVKADVDKINLELAEAKAKQVADEKAKAEFAANEAKEIAEFQAKQKADAEAAEKSRLEAEAKAKKEAEELDIQRKTLAFGVRLGKFEGDNDAEKKIMADNALTASQKFKQLIDLQTASK